MTTIASDEHDIPPVQRFLRDGTEATKEERTNGKNLPDITFRNLHETFSTLLRFCMPMYSSHLRSLP